jgi:DNA-binding transcriptional LysR family regulator
MGGFVDWQEAFQYKIDWFTTFVAVAEDGGFSAAAATLHRSQSRISVHVAELERALDVKLFDRSVHPVVLTPEGRGLLGPAKNLLSTLSSLGDFRRGGGALPPSEVRLGLYPSAASFLFPPLSHRLCLSNPALRLVLWEAPTVALEEGLLEGNIDLAIRAVDPPPETSRLSHKLIWREPLVAVVHEDSSLTQPMSLRDLAREPLILIGDAFGRGGSRFEANRAFEVAHLAPAVAYQTSEPQTLVALVRHGLGTGLTNALAMHVSNLDGVRLLPVLDNTIDREVAIFWRTDQFDSPARRLVFETISEVVADARTELGDQADRTLIASP